MPFVPRTDAVDDVMAVDVNEAYGATLTNSSGGALVLGDVVIQDTAAASSFTTTTTVANPKVLGVLGINTANAATGLVQTRGPMVGVKVNGAVAIGDYLVTHSTATRAISIGTVWHTGVFAIAQTANASGDGTITANLIGRCMDTTLELRTASGDPAIVYDIDSVNKFYVGVDDSDSDKFEIGAGSVVGTTPYLTIDSGGRVGIGEGTPTATTLLLHLRGMYPTIKQHLYRTIGTGYAFNMFDLHIENDTTTVNVGQIGAYGLIVLGGTPTISYIYLSALASPAYNNANIYLMNSGRVGIGDAAPGELLDVAGNINATGVYKVDDVQVVSNRVVDARCDDAINSGDATTDGVIDALRDAMITHGLIAAA